MSKRKHMEDAPGSETFPDLPRWGVPQPSMRENDTLEKIGKGDLRVICGDQVFHAHKLIVCPQSQYFKKACSGGFKEASEPIRLNDQEAALVRKVLEYMYTGTYTLDFAWSGKPSEGSTTGLGEVNMSQSDSTPHSESNAGLSKPGPFAQVLSKSATTPEPGIPPPLCASASPQPQENASLSSNHVSGGPSEGVSDQDFAASRIENPAYLHARMFAAGDYFMIRGLKRTAANQFNDAFTKDPNKEALEQTIAEIYSKRANYNPLKRIAVAALVMKHLKDPNSKNESLMSFELTRSFPEFTHDLCRALINNAS